MSKQVEETSFKQENILIKVAFIDVYTIAFVFGSHKLLIHHNQVAIHITFE